MGVGEDPFYASFLSLLLGKINPNTNEILDDEPTLKTVDELSKYQFLLPRSEEIDDESDKESSFRMLCSLRK
jgi:hypothetical protein